MQQFTSRSTPAAHGVLAELGYPALPGAGYLVPQNTLRVLSNLVPVVDRPDERMTLVIAGSLQHRREVPHRDWERDPERWVRGLRASIDAGANLHAPANALF